MPNALSVAYGAAAGSSPPAVAVEPKSRDDSGLIYFGTGTATTTGILATITLGANYTAPDGSAIPRIIGQFQGSHQPSGIYYTVTTNSIVINCPNAPALSLAATQSGGIVFVWQKFS